MLTNNTFTNLLNIKHKILSLKNENDILKLKQELNNIENYLNIAIMYETENERKKQHVKNNI